VPTVPATWFRDDPRQTAAAYQRLCAATAEFRSLLDRVPELDTALVRRVTETEAFADGAQVGRSPVTTSCRTLRERLAVLTEAEKRLEAVRAEVAATQQASQGLGKLLGLDLAGLELARLRTGADRVARLLEQGPVPPGWWAPDRRTELTALVRRCID